ncbi:MAG: ECF transporter S component [Oscillospiraceae bacterium]|nr:ECF transporter S component [Oscillospiraceae bacterium]
MSRSSLHTRRIAISAIFLSIALVLRLLLTFYLPIYGQNGARVNVGTIFAILPAILFGPVYGAIVAGLFDLLGFLLRPSGAYIPWMTIVVATGGLLRGFLWRGLRNRNRKTLRVCILLFAVLLLFFGSLNMVFLHLDGIDAQFYDHIDAGPVDTGDMHLISRLLVERTQNAGNPGAALSGMRLSVTWGPIGAAAFALLLLAVDRVLSKWLAKEERQSPILPLTITILFAGLFVSTLNTLVLHPIFWPAIPFAAVWAPRAAVSLLVDVVFVYFVALLLGLFERQDGLRDLIE